MFFLSARRDEDDEDGAFDVSSCFPSLAFFDDPWSDMFHKTRAGRGVATKKETFDPEEEGCIALSLPWFHLVKRREGGKEYYT